MGSLSGGETGFIGFARFTVFDGKEVGRMIAAPETAGSW